MSDESVAHTALEGFTKATEILRSIDPRAEVASVVMLLEVMKAHPKGILQGVLREKLGVTHASISRNTSSWTKSRYDDRRIKKRSKGVGLVLSQPDDMDLRTNRLSLTSKGVAAMNAIISSIEQR